MICYERRKALVEHGASLDHNIDVVVSRLFERSDFEVGGLVLDFG
jgi:hypothetical protein